LARYPRRAERLLADLVLVDRVSQTPMASARPGSQDQAWAAAQERIADIRSGNKRPRASAPAPSPRVGFGGILRPVAFAAVALLFFASTGGALAYAAQDAPPDHPLYAVKLASDDVRLWIVFDESQKADILLGQSDSRMDDILEMVGDGKSVPENAIADMHSRNRRAAEIMLENPNNVDLRTDVLAQAQRQEDVLVALWPEVGTSTTASYTRAVAQLHNTRLDGGSGGALVAVRPEDLAGGIVDISGQATEISDGVWDVGGVEISIDDRTIGRDQLEAGSSARFVIARSAGGRLYALSLYGPHTGPPPTGAFVSGQVENVTSEGITVAGNFIPFSSTTLQTGRISVGKQVHITLRSTEDGIVADSVRIEGDDSEDATRSFTFEGTIEGDITSTNIWKIGGFAFEITPRTSFDARAGSAVSGARVQVEATHHSGALEVKRLTVLGSSDPAETVSIIGTFQGYDQVEGIWTVSGITVVPPETGQDPSIDAPVFVVARREGADLVVTAYASIDSTDGQDLIRLEGTILDIQGATWTMEFGEVRVGSTVDVTGDPEVGTRAILWAQQGHNGALEGVYAVVIDDIPVLTPTPSPAPTAAPTQ
jgi:hypothetical protein